MKAKIIVSQILILGLLFAACKEKEQMVIVEEVKVDLISEAFPEAKAEIQETLDGLFKSIQDKDANKLISYHVYSPKFTEFRNQEPRFGALGNEEYERGFVGAISDFDYTLGDLKIDVFGDVAIVTFEADFRPTMEDQVNQIWANVTLVFVKIDGTWKITHEHFSQIEKEKKTG